MATINEKMTNLADEIRTLSGTSSPMGLDGMITNIENANNEIDTQADLINQIVNALQDKASFNTIYVSASAPTDDVGVNGDIYIVRGE